MDNPCKLTWCDASNIGMVSSVGDIEHRLGVTRIKHLQPVQHTCTVEDENTAHKKCTVHMYTVHKNWHAPMYSTTPPLTQHKYSTTPLPSDCIQPLLHHSSAHSLHSTTPPPTHSTQPLLRPLTLLPHSSAHSLVLSQLCLGGDSHLQLGGWIRWHHHHEYHYREPSFGTEQHLASLQGEPECGGHWPRGPRPGQKEHRNSPASPNKIHQSVTVTAVLGQFQNDM